MYTMEELRAVDPEIAACIDAEAERQNSHIELIASENWVSKAVMAAMGSPLTNKYAEGYPGKRYYGGCDCVDVVENLAIERAKRILESGEEVLIVVDDVYTSGTTLLEISKYLRMYGAERVYAVTACHSKL